MVTAKVKIEPLNTYLGAMDPQGLLEVVTCNTAQIDHNDMFSFLKELESLITTPMIHCDAEHIKNAKFNR